MRTQGGSDMAPRPSERSLAQGEVEVDPLDLITVLINFSSFHAVVNLEVQKHMLHAEHNGNDFCCCLEVYVYTFEI
ncbi:hypothetical protein RJT34_07749 [Clitoria ternatea]|uniref:Uncharacterized protein n=1 Tax=Clitoria ternatea TaxID=43366 RepID=A0AAN9PTP4_CLITE